jgi:hypothetical protein
VNLEHTSEEERYERIIKHVERAVCSHQTCFVSLVRTLELV